MRALELGIPITQPATAAELDTAIADLVPDLAVVVSYGMIVPPATLSRPRLGMVNLHFSLLPRWRGAAPVERAILSGDDTTGVTLMQMEAGLDTGPILAAWETSIGWNEDGGSLSEWLAFGGAELLATHLGALASGELAPRPQDESTATWAPRLTTAEARLDFSQPAEQVVRAVRAFCPPSGRPHHLAGQALQDPPGTSRVRAAGAGLPGGGRGHGQGRDRRRMPGAPNRATGGQEGHGCRGLAERSQGRPGSLRMKPGVPARSMAARLVGRVVRGGAWSNVVVREIDLPPDDARLVRHLVYGTIRNLPRLDRAIAGFSSRPLSAIHLDLLDVLRVAFYEVLFGRAAAHAVPDMAVESARRLGRARATGFVNALVRNLQRDGEPDPPSDPAGVFSLPGWVMDDLTGTFGADQARAFAEAAHQDAPVTFRMRPGSPPPVAAVPTAVPGALIHPQGRVPLGAVVQDAASVAVVEALRVRPGDRVLEVGAAPGGKTLAIWDRQPGSLAAVDIHPRRIVRAARRLDEAEYGGWWIRADGRRLPFKKGRFDKVLVDAPCTGLGTLRRRPEIRLRVSRSDRDRLALLQRRMLDQAMAAVRPGGRVVYSVCTLTRAETLGVVEDVGGRPPDDLPGLRLDHGLLLGPHLTGTDGMFISVVDP